MDFCVLVAPALDTSLSLGQVTRAPGCVQIMQSNQPVLDVGPGTRLLRRTNQDMHLSAADFGEQLFFLDVCFGFVYKYNLLRFHAAGNELPADVVVYVDEACFFPGCACGWCGNVAENQLCKLFRVALTPVFQHICDAQVDLRPRLVWKQRVDDTLVKPQPAPVGRYL